MTAAALLIAIAHAGQSEWPAPGSYLADFRHVPAKEAGPSRVYFRYPLLLLRDGRFVLCGADQTGYWRTEKQKVVLMFDGFFRLKSLTTESVLRKAWPKNTLEGLVLEKGRGGVLTLTEWGRVPGPILFKLQKPKPLKGLLVTWSSTEASPENTEAFYLVRDRLESEWREILKVIADPANHRFVRISSANLLFSLKDPAGVQAAAKLILTLSPVKDERLQKTLRRSLARVVNGHPTVPAADLLLEAERKKLIPPASVAPVLAKLGRESDVPVLLAWLKSRSASDRSASLEALTAIGTANAYGPAVQMTNDPEEEVRIAANALVARTTSDPAERQAAIARIVGSLKSSEFMTSFRVIDALGASRAQEAVPQLLLILNSTMASYYRRNAAMALGNLADPRAVFGLTEALQRRAKTLDDLSGEIEVRKAVTAALAKIGSQKRSHS